MKLSRKTLKLWVPVLVAGSFLGLAHSVFASTINFSVSPSGTDRTFTCPNPPDNGSNTLNVYQNAGNEASGSFTVYSFSITTYGTHCSDVPDTIFPYNSTFGTNDFEIRTIIDGDAYVSYPFYTTNGILYSSTSLSSSCSDGIQNQDETGIDVGGVCGNLTFVTAHGYATPSAIDPVNSLDFSSGSSLLTTTGANTCPSTNLLFGWKRYNGQYPDNDDTGASNSNQLTGNVFSGTSWSDYSNVNISNLGLPDGDYWFKFRNANLDSHCNPTVIGDYVYFNFHISNGVPVPETSACTVDCFSNVLFLPGLMGSRLYDSIDKELWVSTDDDNQAELSLDNQGKSIDSMIHTKDDTQRLDGDGDEAGIVDDVFGFNIYQSFIDDLKNWKQDGTIVDYAFVPYDWRLSLDDIITNGVDNNGNLSYNIPQNFSESFILKKLEALQSNSKSDKVTIIAHSNGGLVAKALVQKLKDTDNPLYDKIDKIILVAVPQIGTPDAVVALLHGTELGYGFIMGKDRSRQLSENMPTVYNLLPSANYFDTVDPAFAVDKIVSFENTPFFNPQTSQYGVFVSNLTELKNYILGTDNRTKPDFSNTTQPNIGNSTLYENAEDIHQILDNWTPSPDIKVIQVAGWGEETIAGLDYKTYRDVAEHLSYTPRFVVDGDSTVVVPSALWMSESSNVERWWVDLIKYNKDSIILKTKHRDILEIPNLSEFIKSEITDSEFSDSDNIVVNNTSTLISNDSRRLHFILHSPLTLGITDAEGNYTGMDPDTKEIEEEISDVDYRQIGEVQILSVPAGTAYTLKLQGYAEGYFSLDVEEQTGNTITDSTLFEGIPSSSSTLATMDITPDFEVSTSQLKVDVDGNETIDQVYPIVEVEVPPVEIEIDTTEENNDNTSASSSGSSAPAVSAEEDQKMENVEIQEETKNLDITQVLGETIAKTESTEKQKEEIQIPRSTQVAEDIPLSASVADSSFSGNWVLYVIILGVLAAVFLFRKFVKI